MTACFSLGLLFAVDDADAQVGEDLGLDAGVAVLLSGLLITSGSSWETAGQTM